MLDVALRIIINAMSSTLFQTLHRESLGSRTVGITMFLLGLTSLVSCTKSATPARTAQAAPAVAPVTLELEKGPAPALPNPMLVTDSVHGGVFESCYQGFKATGNAEKDLAQMTSLCGPPNSMKPVTGST